MGLITMFGIKVVCSCGHGHVGNQIPFVLIMLNFALCTSFLEQLDKLNCTNKQTIASVNTAIIVSLELPLWQHS